MPHQFHHAATPTHHCSERILRLPCGVLGQLASLVGDCGKGLGLAKSKAAAERCVLVLESFLVDSDSMRIMEESVPRLGRKGEALRTRSFKLSGLFDGPFHEAEIAWAQQEERSRRLRLPAPLWGGLSAPEECFGFFSVCLKSFEPFASALWIAYPVASTPIGMGKPDSVYEYPETLEGGRKALSELAAQAPLAAPWIERAILQYEDNAFPLLAPWGGFANEAMRSASYMAIGPIAYSPPEDFERSQLDQREAFVLYLPGEAGQIGGFWAKDHTTGPLASALLHPTAKEASESAGRHRHAVARVSVRVEETCFVSPGCDPQTLRSICAQREAEAFAAAIDSKPEKAAPSMSPAARSGRRARI